MAERVRKRMVQYPAALLRKASQALGAGLCGIDTLHCIVFVLVYGKAKARLNCCCKIYDFLCKIELNDEMGVFIMTIIQFESTVEGNLIRIPEEYIDQIPSNVAVTLAEVEEPHLKPKPFENRQTHRSAFEDFFAAMAEIDDEPINDEVDAVLSKRVQTYF
jgi:hypothetical protein